MFDDLQHLLIASGYVGIFLWAFIEGEVGMVLAGSLAQQGYFSYKWVAVTAFMGGFFGDQFYFWLGRYYGSRVFDRFPRIGVHAGKARDLLNRYNTLFILTNRFMYGVRIVGPIVVGTTNISSRKFLWLNMISTIVWAVTVTGLGFAFADAVEYVVDHIHRAEQLLVGIVVTVGVGYWLYQRRRR
ncbi:MAG: DedA family protein [Acidobacteria bacterium]|nr:DedA family protein [Acidobacteriota bacterium]